MVGELMARIARHFGYEKPTDITDEATRHDVKTRLADQRKRVIAEYRRAEEAADAAAERVIDEVHRP